MSTIKNGQILLYCHFNKIIKEPGTSFQSLRHSVKNMLEMFVIQNLIKFHFDKTSDSKEISISVTCIMQQYL